MIAYALEVEPGLLPWMPELLSDFDELGSSAPLIVEVLRKLEVPRSARVLDLGCGKGAVAVAIAKELRCRVEGLELFRPFIDSCLERASAAGVSDLCRFRHGDILKMAGRTEPADVVVYAALGDVLGPLDETVGVIRRFLRPGGFLLVADDCVKDGDAPDSPVSASRSSREETLRRLQSHGDRLLQEITEPGDQSETYARELAQIRARAEGLAERHPELAPDLMRYVDGQRLEYAYMAEHAVPVLWVLQRVA